MHYLYAGPHPLPYALPDAPIAPVFDPTDTTAMVTVFDSETYEEKTISRAEYDSMALAEYQKEMQLWQLKQDLKKPVILLGNADTAYLHQLQKGQYLYEKISPELGPLLTQLTHLEYFKWDVSKINPPDGFNISNLDAANIAQYKYALAGLLCLSDICFNEDKTMAAVMGQTHYWLLSGPKDQLPRTISQTGTSWIVFLKKGTTGWEPIQGIGLGEE